MWKKGPTISATRAIRGYFQSEEDISGIKTYWFSYRGDLDTTPAYPDVEVETGQTITCFDFELDFWVEPTTGEVVRYREWCEGDYVVDTASGEKLYAISRWGAESSGDDLLRQADKVKTALRNYNWMTRYIPLLLLVAGLALLGAGIAANMMNRREGVAA
jgi:Porin PorA